MSRLDVAFSPTLLEPEALEGAVAVVIDVLRATTTITCALASGAEGVIPVATPGDAFARQRLDERGLLIGGERFGKPLPGFDFGNSPIEYTPEGVAGRIVLLTTTNGTKAMLACRNAAEMWIASFLNRRACAEMLREKSRVLLVGSGKEGRFCLEDTVCAGAIISGLAQVGVVDCTDAALAALALYERWETDLEGLLMTCEHGCYLASIGLAADLSFCARLDTLDVNGSLTDGMVRCSAT